MCSFALGYNFYCNFPQIIPLNTQSFIPHSNTNPTGLKKLLYKICGVFYPCRRRASKSKTGMSLVPKLSEKQTPPRLNTEIPCTKKCFLPLWRFLQKIPTLSEWTDVDTSYFYCTPHLVWILLSICTAVGCRVRQDQSVLSPGGCQGAHRRLRSIQPWMHRCRDTSSWIWLAPAR